MLGWKTIQLLGRIYTPGDNRRGTLLKKLQNSSSNDNILHNNKVQVHGSESPVNKKNKKRDSSDTGGPEHKKSRISWP